MAKVQFLLDDSRQQRGRAASRGHQAHAEGAGRGAHRGRSTSWSVGSRGAAPPGHSQVSFDWSMSERAQRLLQRGHLSEASAIIVSGHPALPPPAVLTPTPLRPPPGLEPPG
eukprot:5548934-Pyramimonas_sp.AAC.1